MVSPAVPAIKGLLTEAVLLCRDGTIKLADFGLSTVLGAKNPRAHSFVGVSDATVHLANEQTHGYLAPVSKDVICC